MFVLGIPWGFPSPSSNLRQDVEGMLSSKEELGSYSSGFLTSLSKLKEQLAFEIEGLKEAGPSKSVPISFVPDEILLLS